jgi:hypothetical protein
LAARRPAWTAYGAQSAPYFEALTIPAAKVHGAFMAGLRMRYARVMSLKEFLAAGLLV